MKTMIVTEGPTDMVLLRRLLIDTAAPNDVGIIVGNGRSSAESLARTLLLKNHPVALVVDAETTEDSKVREQELILRESLQQANPGGSSLVVLFKPEIEQLLFEERALAEELFQQRLSDEQWVKSRFAPKEVVTELLRGEAPGMPMRHRLVALLDRLGPPEMNRLRSSPNLQRLHDFICSNTAAAA
jgi:hypothetical protein